MTYRVAIIESEKGWGQKVDEVLTFDNKEARDKYIVEFNAKNNLEEVPDWYMFATTWD